MATTPTPPKTPRPRRVPPAAIERILDNMKRSTLQGKLTGEELDKVANLANALKLFLTA